MIFTSYAQNFEDLMLWRALSKVANGFYIDIGAQDPEIDSVSKAFYESGWRGVHVEPVPSYAERLRNSRPDEVVLQVALSDCQGLMELNVIDGTGLSTGVAEYAKKHLTQRNLSSKKIVVPTLTLDSALQSFAGRDIHWMKIDVEGFELEVLKGWDSKKIRPWILVVEATIPDSPELNYQAWDYLVVNAGYKFVYFDGLNRFYLDNNRLDLEYAFKVPPNVFDNVRLSGTASSELCRGMQQEFQLSTDALNKQLSVLERNLDLKQEEASELAEMNKVLEGSINKITQTVSDLERNLDLKQEEASELAEMNKVLEGSINKITQTVSDLERNLDLKQEEVIYLLRLCDNSTRAIHNLSESIQLFEQRMNAEIDINHDLRIKLRLAMEHGLHMQKYAEELDRDLRDRVTLLNSFRDVQLELDAVYSSKSWFVTTPLRKLNKIAKTTIYKIVQLIAKLARTRPFKSFVIFVMKVISRNYRVKGLILRMLNLDRFPKLHSRLVSFYQREVIKTLSMISVGKERLVNNESLRVIYVSNKLNRLIETIK